MTREEAIRTLQGMREEAGASEDAVCYVGSDEDIKALDMAIEALKAEPAEHGRWTVTETDDGEGGEAPHLICSECKSEPMAWSSKRFFNYCPNCGAKMDKGGEDE